MRLLGFSLALITSMMSAIPCLATDQTVTWVQIREGMFIAENQHWKSSIDDIQFSAIKFHLGYYMLKLVDVSSYADRNKQAISNANDNRRFSDSLLDVGVKTILKTWPQNEQAVAVISAGWSATVRAVEQVGLLRIDGLDYSDFSDNPGMSAVVCLNSEYFVEKGYDFQVPTFYRYPSYYQEKMISKCKDALQIGPRIIEDPAKFVDIRGIVPAEQRSSPQIRTVFAVDGPDRTGHFSYKDRENARDAIFLITNNPVHLLSIQEMLLNPKFYSSTSVMPGWAVNLVNGGPSGIAFADKIGSEPDVFGNPSGVFGSAIVITKRP